MHLLRKTEGAAGSPISADVLRGLSDFPKHLPPRLFYDQKGSELFEKITALPEYYLTRTEQSIFQQYAGEILDEAGSGLTLIELGAGTAAKTSLIIRALLQRQLSATFYPIDVSASALSIAEKNLAREFPALKIIPIVGDYASGLMRLRLIPGRKMAMFIGSSIGNFEPAEAIALLQTIRDSLTCGDTLLLGTDMVKDEAILDRAYNDSQGITAAFNLNLLARINRELGADFELQAFRHLAIWNAQEQRIEMHLESLRDQEVNVPGIASRFAFAKGERIHTENSYKFTPEQVRRLMESGGLKLEKTWMDGKGWFGVHLARV